MIRFLLFAIIALLLSTFPATWLLMLFLGNLGTGLSYWGTLPLGILVSALLAAVLSGPTLIDARDCSRRGRLRAGPSGSGREPAEAGGAVGAALVFASTRCRGARGRALAR